MAELVTFILSKIIHKITMMRKRNILLSTNVMMRKILTKIIHKINMIINEGEPWRNGKVVVT